MELQKGMVYKFKVMDINEAYDQFRGNLGVKYCHGYCLEYDGLEYNCQICTDHTTQNFCKIGDIIEAKISKFTRGQYTLENIRVVTSGLSFKMHKDEEDEFIKKAKDHRPGPTPAVGNVLLRGSAAEIALQQAVSFVSKASHMPNVDFPDAQEVLRTADLMYNWLLEKNK